MTRGRGARLHVWIERKSGFFFGVMRVRPDGHIGEHLSRMWLGLVVPRDKWAGELILAGKVSFYFGRIG